MTPNRNAKPLDLEMVNTGNKPQGPKNEITREGFSDFSKGYIFGCLMCGFIFVVFALAGK